MEEIIKIIFSRADDRLQEEFSYIFDTVIKTNARNELLINRIDFLCEYIKNIKRE